MTAHNYWQHVPWRRRLNSLEFFTCFLAITPKAEQKKVACQKHPDQGPRDLSHSRSFKKFEVRNGSQEKSAFDLAPRGASSNKPQKPLHYKGQLHFHVQGTLRIIPQGGLQRNQTSSRNQHFEVFSPLQRQAFSAQVFFSPNVSLDSYSRVPCTSVTALVEVPSLFLLSYCPVLQYFQKMLVEGKMAELPRHLML